MDELLYIVNDFAVQHFSDQLFNTEEGKSVALSYFKKRGLREDTIRAFGLGYAPDQRDLLLQRARNAGHSVELLKKTGLCSQEGNRDFFRARVMFSIHSLSGKVAAFAGRTMSSDKTIPKYVNSPETEIYVKNKLLYGAFQAKKAIRQQDECILVEGYMDVISLHQAGIENVVASSGTTLTEGQLLIIKRNTKNLKILYDGDEAGIDAALKTIDIALPLGIYPRFAIIPFGLDPDSYIHKYGYESLIKIICNSKSFVEIIYNDQIEKTIGFPDKKSNLAKKIVGKISLIDDPEYRSIYSNELCNLFGFPIQIINNEIEKQRHNITTWQNKKQKRVKYLSKCHAKRQALKPRTSQESSA